MNIGDAVCITPDGKIRPCLKGQIPIGLVMEILEDNIKVKIINTGGSLEIIYNYSKSDFENFLDIKPMNRFELLKMND